MPSADPVAAARPVQLGKYALLGAIGRGGMADVYLAMARGPSGVRKLVVVKCMRSGSELDSTLTQMFLDEGRLAALFSHANVVHTYEVGQVDQGGQGGQGGQGDQSSYIVMEYLHGQALSAIARVARPLAPRISARIAADALFGLHYVHELRDLDGTPLSIVHRDLSPPNIFLTHDGVVKLVDFGIAKTAITTRASTEAGLVKGKLAYMAPEQTTSGVVDRRADIYAMGVVLWELLAARRLASGPSPSAVVHQTLHGVAPLVSSIRPELDPALDRIVERALRRDPEARYATALEMRAALEEFLAQGSAIGGQELAQLMAEHFSAQRELRERQIQSWVAAFAPEQPAEIEALRDPGRGALGMPEGPELDTPGEQPTAAFTAALRSPRMPLRSQPGLVRGALIAGLLLLGLMVFALHQSQGHGVERANAAERALGAAAATRVTDSKPSRMELDPNPNPAAASRAEASSPRSINSALRARPAPARQPSASPKIARLTNVAPADAPQSPAIATMRMIQQKAKEIPELERNPYMHTE